MFIFSLLYYNPNWSSPHALHLSSHLLLDAATIDLLGGLGHEPESLCSQDTAGRLAKRAYGRAAELSTPGEPIIGLACTASLTTVRSQPHTHCVANIAPITCSLALSVHDIVMEECIAHGRHVYSRANSKHSCKLNCPALNTLERVPSSYPVVCFEFMVQGSNVRSTVYLGLVSDGSFNDNKLCSHRCAEPAKNRTASIPHCLPAR